MPCMSSGPEPSSLNRLLRETAALLSHVHMRLSTYGGEHEQVKKLCLTPTRLAEVRQVARDEFADKDFAPDLCRILNRILKLDSREFDKLVYNAKDHMSRRLADWWEEHERNDLARKKLSSAADKRKKTFTKLWKNASRQERALLKSLLTGLDREERDVFMAVVHSSESEE